MSFFERNSEDQNKMALSLSNRQLTWVLAGTLLLCFFSFIAGYFLGKKKVFERFSHKTEQDSLADTIASSMYAMYGEGESLDLAESNDSNDSDDAHADEQTSSDDVRDTAQESRNTPTSPEEPKENSNVSHYAELAGFGSLRQAQSMTNRLHNKGIDVVVKKEKAKRLEVKLSPGIK